MSIINSKVIAGYVKPINSCIGIVDRCYLSTSQIYNVVKSFKSTTPKTGILMLNMGGPQTIDKVHDFLYRLFMDRDIIKLPMQKYLGPWIAKRRTPKIQEQYAKIGGGSPIFKWTNLQGQIMCSHLDSQCPDSAPHKHYVAFRYADPLTEDSLQQMENDGIQHCIVFSQYPQYSCATTGSSMNAIYKFYTDRSIEMKMRFSVIDRWCLNPFLAKCFADNIAKEIAKFSTEQERREVFLLFSAHSLPLKQVQKGDPYPAEVGATVQLVMQKLAELGHTNPHRLVWQSKVGPLPWLTPATHTSIEGLVHRGRRNIILVPIAFTSDHIETLYEMDIEYAQDLGNKVGALNIRRCAAPNDHPLFIDAIVDEVKLHLKQSHKCSEQFLVNCPMCDNENCYEAKKWFRYSTKKF